jgi:hypothetical protein
MADSVTEIGGGTYEVDVGSGENNAESVGLRFTATGAAPREFYIRTEP